MAVPVQPKAVPSGVAMSVKERIVRCSQYMGVSAVGVGTKAEGLHAAKVAYAK